MYILVDFHPFAKEFPSNGELFSEDFFHALFRNHPQDIFYLWTTGDDDLPHKYRFEDYANVRRVHTAIKSSKLYWLIRFLGYPFIDDLVETLAMKNGHLPWVAKFDVAFFSTPYPLLLEDDCFTVQFTSHLKPLHYPELYTNDVMKYQNKKWYKNNIEQADLNVLASESLKKDISSFAKNADNFCVAGIGLTNQISQFQPQKQNMQDHIEHEHSFSEMEDAYKEQSIWDSLPKDFFFVRGERASVAMVIKSFELFRARFPEKDWEMIIEEPYLGAFQDIIPQYKISIMNPIGIDKKEIMLSKCFAFIDASFYDSEGKELLQAMRCGAVCLVSNHWVFPAIIRSENFLFDPQSYSKLFSCMKNIYLDESLYRNTSEENIIESQKPKYSWDDITMKIMKEVQTRLEKREFEE